MDSNFLYFTLGIFVIFFISSIFLIIYLKKLLNKVLEGMKLENKEKQSDFKSEIKEEFYSLKDNLKDNIIDLNKDINETIFKNVENTHQTSKENIKDISEMLSQTFKENKEHLNDNMTSLQKEVGEHLEKITNKVDGKLDSGFDKSNKIFNEIINKINLIEEAQNKIEDLSKNVTDLQNVLSDKQSRGAWGEVQLERIIGNTFPRSHYETQYKLSNGKSVDFLLRIPDPAFDICVDSKFPFENYKRMVGEKDKLVQEKYSKSFKSDVKKHIDAIASKYIVVGETSDFALMFLPAEAVFSEIHSYHYDLVEYAQNKKVLIVSPTTMTAILTTAYSAIKDDSMKRQLTKIKSTLTMLYKDFDRFQIRMEQLKSNVSKVNKDIEDIEISKRKIDSKLDKIQTLEFNEKPKGEISEDK
jgi:DNA recombination protein RmuC